MSVSKWAYVPCKCDGDFCPGECDLCDKAKINIEELTKLAERFGAKVTEGRGGVTVNGRAVTGKEIFAPDTGEQI